MTAASYSLARFPLRWYDATFADPALEQEFQTDEAASSLLYARYALGVAAALFACFGITDWLFSPTAIAMTAIRAVTIVILLLGLFVSFNPRMVPWHQLVMQGGAVAIGLGFVGIIALTPSELLTLYMSCVILVLIGIFVVLRLGVLRAAVAVLIVVAALDVVYLAVGLGDRRDFIIYQVMMLSAFIIGYFSSYVYERQRRVAYIGRREAEHQARALERTAKRAAEAQLRAEQAARVKTDFVAHISHELRTPLNAVIGFGELLERQIFGPLGNPKYIEYAHDIRESGQHLLSLINDVLDLSKIEAGRMELNWETLVPQEVVRASLVLVSAQANARGTPIRIEVSDDLPLLYGDARAIKQILVNLLSNALKFTPSGGDVRIVAEAEDDGVLFTVSDDGPGMTPAEIEIALTPFGQVSGMVADSERGTGLGLALANRLAELHGHPLEIRSAPGRGTRVSFRVPRSESAQARLPI